MNDYENIQYMFIWSVDLDEYKQVVRAEIYKRIEMDKIASNEAMADCEYEPSDLYILNAIHQFKDLDWSNFERGATNIGAISYLYQSRPNDPVCTNSQER